MLPLLFLQFEMRERPWLQHTHRVYSNLDPSVCEQRWIQSWVRRLPGPLRAMSPTFQTAWYITVLAHFSAGRRFRRGSTETSTILQSSESRRAAPAPPRPAAECLDLPAYWALLESCSWAQSRAWPYLRSIAGPSPLLFVPSPPFTRAQTLVLLSVQYT